MYIVYVRDTSTHQLDALLDALADRLADRIAARLNGNEKAPKSEPAQADQLLTASEAAKRLGVSKRYIYAHRDEYPFARRLGPKTLRFSERGLERWLVRTK